MSQRVRSIEDFPEEAVELAEVASLLIVGHPENRRAFAELAAVFAAGAARFGAGNRPEVASTTRSGAFDAFGTSLPVVIATFAMSLSESAARIPMTLPSAERELWEDAGASFEQRGIQHDAVNAAAAFAELVMRSIEGDLAVATLLRVDRSRISQRVRDRSLYAFSHGDSRYFPRWQFTGDTTLAGLREVTSALDDGLHPLVADHWFNTPSVDLEIGEATVSPLTWLATGGNPQVVAELAADL